MCGILMVKRINSHHSLLKRFVVPVSARIHSKDRVVDAAQVVRQGEFGAIPQVSTRACLVDLEHRAIRIVHHLDRHRCKSVFWGLQQAERTRALHTCVARVLFVLYTDS